MESLNAHSAQAHHTSPAANGTAQAATRARLRVRSDVGTTPAATLSRSERRVSEAITMIPSTPKQAAGTIAKPSEDERSSSEIPRTKQVRTLTATPSRKSG